MSGLNNNEFRLHQFSVEVCDIIRQIPAGKVLTYGQIARLAGFSNYSRWVGKVLSHHPGTADLPFIILRTSETCAVILWRMSWKRHSAMKATTSTVS